MADEMYNIGVKITHNIYITSKGKYPRLASYIYMRRTQIVQTDEKLRSDGPLHLHDRAIVHEYTIFLPIMTM